MDRTFDSAGTVNAFEVVGLLVKGRHKCIHMLKDVDRSWDEKRDGE